MHNSPQSYNDTHQSILFIEGDGIGPDITKATQTVANTAWEKEYGKQGSLQRNQIYAGISDIARGGSGLSNETTDAIAESWLTIKGPMATPVGKGFRSFNVALRKQLDLYACIRPIKYYPGTPTMHIAPYGIDMTIFRENTEDLYSGNEYPANSETAKQIIEIINADGGAISTLSAIGIKNISQHNSERLIKAAVEYAEKNSYRTFTLGHKGNIMKHTEGAFRNRGYALVKRDFENYLTENEKRILNYHKQGHSVEQIAQNMDREFYPYMSEEQKEASHRDIQEVIDTLRGDGISREYKKVINDIIADNLLQQAILNPHKFGSVALTNLNGDYASDAFAGSIGGLGIAPGANYNPQTGALIAEATHGTAGDLAKDKGNPLSHLLSFKLGCELKGHPEVAARIDKAVGEQILSGRVTGDFYNTAKNIYTKIKAQDESNTSTPGIKHLLAFAQEQFEGLTVLGTQQFAEEIAQRIADQE